MCSTAFPGAWAVDPAAGDSDGPSGTDSRRRGFHFADASSTSLLRRLLKGERGDSRMTSSPTARPGPLSALPTRCALLSTRSDPLQCLDKPLPVRTWRLRGLYARVRGPCKTNPTGWNSCELRAAAHTHTPTPIPCVHATRTLTHTPASQVPSPVRTIASLTMNLPGQLHWLWLSAAPLRGTAAEIAAQVLPAGSSPCVTRNSNSTYQPRCFVRASVLTLSPG